MIFRSCILLPYSSSFFSFGPGIHGRCLPRVCIPPSSSSFFQLYLITGSPLLLLFYFSLWSSCGGRVYWNRLCSFRMGAGDWSAVHFSLEWVLETGEGLIFSYGVGWKLAGSVFFFFPSLDVGACDSTEVEFICFLGVDTFFNHEWMGKSPFACNGNRVKGPTGVAFFAIFIRSTTNNPLTFPLPHLERSNDILGNKDPQKKLGRVDFHYRFCTDR